ncbi:MAG: hypothetical protein IPG77_05655 [Betaproteobacteria bacterium]|nr:hypothetical protein [Betaproteobacteria bacterium]
MATVIAGIAPELAATLAIPAGGDPVRRPHGRHRGIPPLAKDLGDGTSAIKPPGAPNTVAWRFDNVTGLITLCTVDPAVAAQTSDLTTANLVCTAQNALGVSGYVRYALTDAQPTEAEALDPPSAPLNSLTVAVTRTDGGLAPICYSQEVAAPGRFTMYHCAVPVTVTVANPTPAWAGSMSMALTPADLMAANQAENSAGRFKVCSYAHVGVYAGAATFTGAGNAMSLTLPFGRGEFRPWAAGSRIDLAYENRGLQAYGVGGRCLARRAFADRVRQPGVAWGRGSAHRYSLCALRQCPWRQGIPDQPELPRHPRRQRTRRAARRRHRLQLPDLDCRSPARVIAGREAGLEVRHSLNWCA